MNQFTRHEGGSNYGWIRPLVPERHFQNRKEFLDDGVVFIPKPFSIADLTEKIREVLDMASDKNQG